MKKLYFLLFFVFSFIANAQIVNIPDANFKTKLVNLGVDTNNDGDIQITEADQVSYLNLSDQNISNLEGINYFVNLNYLDFSGILLL